MPDLLLVLTTVFFFALAAGLVVACERLLGPDTGTEVDAGRGDRR